MFPKELEIKNRVFKGFQEDPLFELKEDHDMSTSDFKDYTNILLGKTY